MLGVQAAFLLHLTAACILLTNGQLQWPYPLLIAMEDKLSLGPAAATPTYSHRTLPENDSGHKCVSNMPHCRCVSIRSVCENCAYTHFYTGQGFTRVP
jgi:hypothetical protein